MRAAFTKTTTAVFKRDTSSLSPNLLLTAATAGSWPDDLFASASCIQPHRHTGTQRGRRQRTQAKHSEEGTLVAQRGTPPREMSHLVLGPDFGELLEQLLLFGHRLVQQFLQVFQGRYRPLLQLQPLRLLTRVGCFLVCQRRASSQRLDQSRCVRDNLQNTR